jgi:antitoxin component YwqK of YwqJK toxin-antitoxin module
MRPSSLFLILNGVLLLLTGCNTPTPLASSGKSKKEYFTGGKLRTEFILQDESGQNGTYKEYDYDGNLMSITPMQNGLPHGTATTYDPKGRIIAKTHYLNGQKEGKEEAYYPNGDVMISYTYRHGLKEGPAYSYNKDGSVNKKVIYANDKIIN